ncbi:nucleotide exchange factor GrpE [soil metagenome]
MTHDQGAPAGQASTGTVTDPASGIVADPTADGRGALPTAPPDPADHVEAGDSDGDAAEESATDLLADLADARSKVAALTEDLQRLQAEYVNYKRRVDRDRELVRENAKYSVLSALLPVLDDLDRARDHGELEGGFKVVAEALERIVSAQGLTKFGAPGDEFDPRFHEALMHAHSFEVTTTTCRDILAAGYQMGDRVVRPARVSVVDPEPTGEQG